MYGLVSLFNIFCDLKLSWALDRKAPIHAKSKIYTLSNAEHDFWLKMVDKTTGHIRNQLRSEDAESMARIGLVQYALYNLYIILYRQYII